MNFPVKRGGKLMPIESKSSSRTDLVTDKIYKIWSKCCANFGFSDWSSSFSSLWKSPRELFRVGKLK